MTEPKDNKTKAEAATLTPVERRLIAYGADIMGDSPQEILYQHSVLCQTFFPYHDPKEEREWTRSNGFVSLFLQGGVVMNPETRTVQKVGLPFGPKSRLLLAHLNSRALKQGSRRIEMEEGSLTAFVGSMQDPLKRKPTAPNGREIRMFKEQIMRLSAANVTLATTTDDNRALHQKPQIIDSFEIWFQKDERQRVLWPEYVDFSETYFESLTRHAVPLDERALAALGHSAMALDVYMWLAQRLHRIKRGQPVFLSWEILKDQFGQGFGRIDNFKRKFEIALRQVLAQYPTANIESVRGGLSFRHSLPPVPPKLFTIKSGS